jgi:hypothetical protein
MPIPHNRRTLAKLVKWEASQAAAMALRLRLPLAVAPCPEMVELCRKVHEVSQLAYDVGLSIELGTIATRFPAAADEDELPLFPTPALDLVVGLSNGSIPSRRMDAPDLAPGPKPRKKRGGDAQGPENGTAIIASTPAECVPSPKPLEELLALPDEAALEAEGEEAVSRVVEHVTAPDGGALVPLPGQIPLPFDDGRGVPGAEDESKLDAALRHALESPRGSGARWAKRRSQGATDDDILAAIRTEWPGPETFVGGTAHRFDGYHRRGGPDPAFFLGLDRGRRSNRADLKGPELIAAVRRVMGIGLPPLEVARPKRKAVIRKGASVNP